MQSKAVVLYCGQKVLDQTLLYSCFLKQCASCPWSLRSLLADLQVPYFPDSTWIKQFHVILNLIRHQEKWNQSWQHTKKTCFKHDMEKRQDWLLHSFTKHLWRTFDKEIQGTSGNSAPFIDWRERHLGCKMVTRRRWFGAKGGPKRIDPK